MTLSLRVNGRDRAIDGAPGATLLDALRYDLGLVAARFGCGAEACGACFVLIDGAATASCTMPVAAAAGREIVTVEGLGSREHPHPLQRAFFDEQAAQCGYCTSGMMIGAVALLRRNPRPAEREVREALDGHLCRCGSHNRIVRAVLRAAKDMST